MSKPKNIQAPAGVSRRSLLVGGAAAVTAGLAGACLPQADGRWPEDGEGLCSWSEPRVTMGHPAHAGQVVEQLNSKLVSTAGMPRVIEAEAAATLKQLLLALSAKTDLQAAWQALLSGYKQGQVVGIKVNTLNTSVPTHKEPVKALVDTLKADAGIPPDKIIVWDRRVDELSKAGFTASYLGCTVEGTQDTATAKGSSRGYEVSPTCIGGINVRLSTIQTRLVDHTINFAVMKNHLAAGYTGVLKNHYGTINTPGTFHDKTAPGGTVLEQRFVNAIPAINALDEIAGTARLWLLDASIGVSKGDTDSPPDCMPNTMMAALDPVALDVRGRQLRDTIAGAGRVKDTVSEGWIKAAERVGLGSTKARVTTLK